MKLALGYVLFLKDYTLLYNIMPCGVRCIFVRWFQGPAIALCPAQVGFAVEVQVINLSQHERVLTWTFAGLLDPGTVESV